MELTLPINQLKRNRRNFELKPYIFFKKLEPQQNYDALWNPRHPVNFRLLINGVTFFNLNWATKTVLIGFGGCSSQLFPLLAGVSPSFESLTLSDCDLPVEAMPGESFKQVLLWGVRDRTPSQLGRFLQQFQNLEKLSCWTKRPPLADKLNAHGQPIPDKSGIDFDVDLTSTKLTRLAICYAKWTHSTLSTQLKTMKGNINLAELKLKAHINLTELYTDHCHWDPAIFEVFHILFPNLKRVSFGYCGHQFLQDIVPKPNERAKKTKPTPTPLVATVTVRLLSNILEIKSIEYVRVAVLDWKTMPFYRKEKDDLSKSREKKDGVSKSRKEKEDLSQFLEEKEDLHNFLKEAGLLMEPYYAYNFKLKKQSNPVTGQLGWIGTLYNPMEFEEHNEW